MKVKELTDEEICVILTSLSFFSLSEKSEDFEFRNLINILIEKFRDGRVFINEK